MDTCIFLMTPSFLGSLSMEWSKVTGSFIKKEISNARDYGKMGNSSRKRSKKTGHIISKKRMLTGKSFKNYSKRIIPAQPISFKIFKQELKQKIHNNKIRKMCFNQIKKAIKETKNPYFPRHNNCIRDTNKQI